MSTITLLSNSRPQSPRESHSDFFPSDGQVTSSTTPNVPVLTERNTSPQVESAESANEICPIFIKQQTPTVAKRMHDLMNDGPALLYNAIIGKNFNAVKDLLTGEGGKLLINQRLNEQGSALSIAAKLGDEAIVRLLLAHGADVDATDANFATPLFMAAQNGHLKIVELLLEADATYNMSDIKKSTPLHVAVREGHVEVVKMLLSKNAEPLRRDKSGFSALHIAAMVGSKELTELLLTRVDKVDDLLKGGITPLFVAAAHGKEQIVEFYLNYLNTFENQPEMLATWVNKTDRWGVTPLVIAAENGHENIVALLQSRTVPASTESLQNAPFATASDMYSKGMVVIGPDSADEEFDYLDKNLRQVAEREKIPLDWFDDKRPERSWQNFKKRDIALGAFGIFDGHCTLDPNLQRHIVNVHRGENVPTTVFIEQMYLLGVRDVMLGGCRMRHAARRMMNRINLFWPKIDPNLRIIFLGGKNGVATSLCAQDIGFGFQDYVDYRRGDKRPGEDSLLKRMSVNSITVLTYDQASGKMVMSHDSLEKIDERSSLSPEQKQIAKQNWLLKRASRGKADAIKNMLDAAPATMDLDYQGVTGTTALSIVAENGHTNVMKLLIERGADINKRNGRGETPLCIATREANIEMVELLLKKGADVNKANSHGITPLHIAADKAHTGLLTLLLTNGADINKADNDGMTPLYFAAEDGKTSMVTLLLKNGADINQADNDGITPLYIATQEGNTEMVTLLLKNRADINQADDEGMTPLYIAARDGNTKMVELLLQNGADINQADNDGMTPLSIAAQEGNTETVELLQKNGANVQ